MSKSKEAMKNLALLEGHILQIRGISFRRYDYGRKDRPVFKVEFGCNIIVEAQETSGLYDVYSANANVDHSLNYLEVIKFISNNAYDALKYKMHIDTKRKEIEEARS